MKLGYVILYVPDVGEAVAFYERAFGVARRFLHESGTYAEMETGTTALAFAAESLVAGNGHPFHPNRSDAPPAGIEVAFVTTDVPAAYAKALDAGATPQDVPHTKPWGQVVAYVRDLNGCLVEICTPVG